MALKIGGLYHLLDTFMSDFRFRTCGNSARKNDKFSDLGNFKSAQQAKDQPWFSGEGAKVSHSEPGFESHCHPYKSLVSRREKKDIRPMFLYTQKCLYIG